MAVSALMANVGKVMAWWREVDWLAFAAYSLPGMPCAALGARTLLVLPPRLVDGALGAFFIVMIPIRRWLHVRSFRISTWQLAMAGGAVGFITGVVLSTGPLSVPAFTAYGLTKGAFLSTEAASSLVLMVSKIITFRELGALPLPTILRGVIVGASVMAGAFAGKQVVQAMSPRAFQRLLDALLLCSGASLIWAAIV
jgi:uncharacterized membrane protein YfcA